MDEDAKEALARIEQQLTRQYKASARGEWIKVGASVATPIIVAIFGYFVQQTLADQAREQRNQQVQTEEQRYAEAKRMEQSRLMMSLMEPLLKGDLDQQALAMQLVSHACGDQGRRLIEAVKETTTNPETREAATKSLVAAEAADSERRQRLVSLLNAESKGQRWNAAHTLATEWPHEPALVRELVAFGRAHLGEDLAVYNTVVVLADLPTSTLQLEYALVTGFLRAAMQTGPKTTELATQVLHRMGPTSTSTE